MVVSELPSRHILGLNQRTYQRLKLSLALNLRRQILIAVCDDLGLRRRLMAQLAHDFAQADAVERAGTSLAQPWDDEIHLLQGQAGSPQLITLALSIHGPDLKQQMKVALQGSCQGKPGLAWQEPCLQIIGIEQLMRQSGAQQRQFLNSLQLIETLINQLNCSLLIWLPWPWFRLIQQGASEFWHCRTGVFEFAGDPTPMETVPSSADPWLSTETLSPALTFMQPAPKPTPAAPPNRRQYPQAQENSALHARPLADRPQASIPSQQVEGKQPQSGRLLQSQQQDRQSQQLAFAVNERRDEQPNPIVYPAHASPAQSSQALSIQDRRDPPEAQANSTEEAETFVTPALAIAPGAGNASTSLPPDPNETLVLESLTTLRRVAPRQMPLEVNLLQRLERLSQQRANPVVLANIYWALGQHYRDRLATGESQATLIEAAIAAYEGAHQGLSATATGQSDLLNDLGSLYWLQAQEIEASTEALFLLKKALVTYQQGTHHAADPDTLSRLHSNLAAVYSVLANHDQPEHHLKQAIAAYHKALQHMQAEAAPLEYASLQNSLGAIYWRLSQFGPARPYLDHAITAYIEARHYCQPHQDPACYAMIQNNLGIAYWSLSQFQQPGLMLKQAIAAYHSALAYRTLAVDPAGCAATQNNLGTAYWELAKRQSESVHRQQKLWQRAIAAYQAALKAVQRLQARQGGTSPLSFDPKMTHHSLAILYRQLAEDQALVSQTRSQHLSRALSHALAAIAVASHTALATPDATLMTLAKTIRAHYQLLGLAGQQEALARVPSGLLPKLLAQL